MLAGTWLQQRVPGRAVALLFAGLLLVDRRRPRGPVIGALAVGFARRAASPGCSASAAASLFVPRSCSSSGLDQVDAEATSLLAIVPVALVGAWRQTATATCALRDALVLGVLAVPGAVAGVALVNALPERAVELAFAALLVFVAVRMLPASLSEEPDRAVQAPARRSAAAAARRRCAARPAPRCRRA